MATWYQSDQLTVANGSTTVTVGDGSDLSAIQEGDALVLASNPPVEIESTTANSLVLSEPWDFSGVTNGTGWVIPTAGAFDKATAALQAAVTQTADMYEVMEDWGSQLGDVTFTDYQGTQHTVKTLRQMESDVDSLIASIGYPDGMRQADMEANRAANRERYAASGFVHFGKHCSETALQGAINQGLWWNINSSAHANTLKLGVDATLGGLTGDSKTLVPVVNIAGFEVHIDELNAYNANQPNQIIFPPAPDGTVTYDSADGTITQHADAATAFASETATNKVVTERVDLAFVEGFLEEVTVSNPFVYPNGCIQSQATTMDGITTVNSTRPSTYFDQYVGQNGSVGKGVDFFAATDAQKSAMLGNPKNNLYYTDDGKLVQFRVRIRTVAGLGNGDWGNIDPSSTKDMSFEVTAPPAVNVQGFHDVMGVEYITNTTLNASQLRDRGAFSVTLYTGGNRTPSTAAVAGEHYILIIGTAQRLNQGAYHPSFNPLGAAYCNRTTTSGPWHNNGVIPLSRASCFNPTISTNTTDAGYNSGTGYIGTLSGRPDGRFYDAIYAGGQGGFRDYRYSAWDTSSAEYREQKLPEVYRGSYRGEEKLLATRVFASSSAATTAGYTIVNSDNPAAVVATLLTDYPASGEFTCTEVIGDPANILLTDALKDGWVGYWIPTIPDGTTIKHSDMKFNRKRIDSGNVSPVTSDDNGASWAVASGRPWDSVGNKQDNAGVPPATRIEIFNFTANAYQTKPADNAVVLNGIQGVGVVRAQNVYLPSYGSLLQESLIGKVAVTGTDYTALALSVYGVEPSGELYTGATATKQSNHTALIMAAGAVPAVKFLPYSVEENGQTSINFAFNELVYSTDWGDDSKIHIASQTTTGTDLNGQSRLIGTATLAIPLGWRKNDV